jgi:signal transduction histidine kinase/CheY-like chemotaxis protein
MDNLSDSSSVSDLYQNRSSAKKLNIPDFCDMEQFEQMLKDWANSTGLATVAVGSDGEYVSRCYNFTDFCYRYTRNSPEGLRRCKACDRRGAGTYLCHAGLVDFAAPITLDDGTVVGNIVGGQVLPEQPDENRFRNTARVLGIDEEAYITALHKVNIRSREEIRASAALLANIINLFVRMSYAAQKNMASLSERAGIISSLGRIYFCDYYIDLIRDCYFELDTTERLHAFAGESGIASATLRKACRLFATPAYVDALLAFTDLSTLKERIGQRPNIAFEFINRDSLWCKALFIAVERDAAGSATHVIYALQYIQEEKEKELETQEALKRSAQEANQANQAKSEFLSRMSHDIRTPLNGIIGMTYLTQKMDLPEAAKDNLAKIDTSSRFLLSLINDVLDMTKAESGTVELHPEPYPSDEFKAYINAVIAPLCRERSQTFIYEPGCVLKDLVPLFDKLRINQVVFNLLSNAVKYTPEGGTICYRVNETLLPENRIAMHVEVIDNGIGMSPGFQKILFEPFTQEDRDDNSEIRGTGLGLAIAKKLVTLMGGTISVKSEPGKGSSFLLDFVLDSVPASQAASAGTGKTDPADADAVLLSKHILLCEDHPLNQEIAEALLRAKGMTVVIADDGQAGCDIFRKSLSGYFDCILMDIRMPVMNGYQAAKAIRAMDRPDAGSVPIIAMTADAFRDDIQKCLTAGMNGHIAKPVDPEKLYAVLAEVLKH